MSCRGSICDTSGMSSVVRAGDGSKEAHQLELRPNRNGVEPSHSRRTEFPPERSYWCGPSVRELGACRSRSM